MSDVSKAPKLRHAVARPSRRLPVIWVIPFLAVAIGAWLAWETLSKQGPTITITFESAEGLQAGQSQLKYKDIVLGTVKNLSFTPDRARVIVTIGTSKEADPFLNDKTIFWVVKPRLFAGNVSGLETLLSGAYIGMRPGNGTDTSVRNFTGLENPPVVDSDVPGHTFLLKASRLGSISLGSPVFFRDLTVGEVLGWDVADMADSVTIHTFVRAPFDSYVNDQTRFWNASGLSVKFGGTGVEFQLESVRALVLGGIAFDNSTTDTAEPTTRTRKEFPLFSDRETAIAASYSRNVSVLSYFPGSIRGLAPGAEVTVRGMKVGEVTDVRLAYDPVTDAIVAPVRYTIQPERILGVGVNQVFPSMLDAANSMLQRGMRARLDTANLLTGQKLVALVVVPDARPAHATMDGKDIVFPAVDSGGISDLQASAGDLLANINAIPFAQIGKNLDGILASINELANSSQSNQALADLATTIGSVQALVRRLDNGLAPVMKQLPEIATGLQKTTIGAARLMQSVDNAYGDNTKFSRDLDRLLLQLNDAVRSIRSLADLLARHPEALVKGRPGARLE
ncbi:MAG: intermembrane transport protein PqiB [Acetobacteraceae bacterium]